MRRVCDTQHCTALTLALKFSFDTVALIAYSALCYSSSFHLFTVTWLCADQGLLICVLRDSA